MMEVTPVGMLGVNCSHHMATMWLLTLITVVHIRIQQWWWW